MSRHRFLLALCVLLLGGCGGSGKDGDQDGPAVTVKAGQPLRVVGKEYSFDPSKLVVRGRGALTISLENRGTLAHNLKVFQGERELGGTPTFQGGVSRSGKVRLRPGRYRLVCTVGNHEELGMWGSLKVR